MVEQKTENLNSKEEMSNNAFNTTTQLKMTTIEKSNHDQGVLGKVNKVQGKELNKLKQKLKQKQQELQELNNRFEECNQKISEYKRTMPENKKYKKIQEELDNTNVTTLGHNQLDFILATTKELIRRQTELEEEIKQKIENLPEYIEIHSSITASNFSRLHAEIKAISLQIEEAETENVEEESSEQEVTPQEEPKESITTMKYVGDGVVEVETNGIKRYSEWQTLALTGMLTPVKSRRLDISQTNATSQPKVVSLQEKEKPERKQTVMTAVVENTRPQAKSPVEIAVVKTTVAVENDKLKNKTREQALSLLRLDAWDIENTVSIGEFEKVFGRMTTDELTQLKSKYVPAKPIQIPKTEGEENLHCLCDDCIKRYKHIKMIDYVHVDAPHTALYQNTVHRITSFERFTDEPNKCQRVVLKKQKEQEEQKQKEEEEKQKEKQKEEERLKNFKPATKEQIAEWCSWLREMDPERIKAKEIEEANQPKNTHEINLSQHRDTKYCPVDMEANLVWHTNNLIGLKKEKLLESPLWQGYIHYGKEQYALLKKYNSVRYTDIFLMSQYEAVEKVYVELREHIVQHGQIITHCPRRTHKKPVMEKKKLGRRAKRNLKKHLAENEDEDDEEEEEEAEYERRDNDEDDDDYDE